MDAGGCTRSTASSQQMTLPGRKTQRLVVALLMATLLGPLGGGLAGTQMGMGMDVGMASQPMDMGEPAHHQMDSNDCAEHDSGKSHRCAGIWSTACCDYFAPGAKVKVEPSLESTASALGALSADAVSKVLGPAEAWGHLILPTAGEVRAGPTSLVILHSALLF